ncbi:hypothetical protein Tco_0990713 [Tanacetum coccineum]|uniref:Uncharacterized protein n=1 Tax=Tanacetum coccineum TaxID=301880 RepID=A0ABQ5EXX8_9ASTR
MDDPNITLEEYIQLMADKAHKRGQMFDWETATYGKIYDDIDLFKDFEAYFPAIVYNDALASDPKVSSEPTVTPQKAIKADFDFTISFSESDDEDYTFICDKNPSSYKLISVNDLKSDTGNDIDEINVKLPSEDISIKPLDSVINVNADTYSQEFDKTIETNHDTPGLFSTSIDTAYPGCMTRSSTKELFTSFKDLEREFCSSRKLFKKLSLDESRSPVFDLFSDLEENSEKEVAETMAETWKNT